jgi:hypothetical protein
MWIDDKICRVHISTSGSEISKKDAHTDYVISLEARKVDPSNQNKAATGAPDQAVFPPDMMTIAGYFAPSDRHS